MADGVLAIQSRVLGALVLRQLRTRFGRTIFGPILLIVWPLSHALLLLIIFAFIRKAMSFGTDPAIFFATGVLPYILFLYPMRQIMQFSIGANRPLVSIPVIKPLDVLAAQAIVYIIISFWVAVLFMFILYLFGADVMPRRLDEAICAFLATIYLGVAIGCLGGVMFAISKVWIAIQILGGIVMYVLSGALWPPGHYPKQVIAIIWYNPLFHCVEWVRSAYYDDYGYGLLDRGYLLGFATVVLLVTLLLERGLRGYLLR